jgi:phage terminase small subunit
MKINESNNLTLKQEKFCQEYIITGNASEAYRRSYNASKMKDETIHKRANELMSNGVVRGRIGELKGQMSQKFEVTKEKLGNILMNRVLLFEEMQELATKPQLTPQEYDKFTRLMAILKASDANKSIDQLSKMFGLNEPDKQEVEHKGLGNILINLDKNIKNNNEE